MAQTYQMHPFDVAKLKISESSQKLYKYLLWSVLIGIVLIVLVLIAVFVFIGLTIDELLTIDQDNIYDFATTIFSEGVVAAIILVLVGVIALIVISIMVYVQYYRLGSGYAFLARADPITPSSQYASYGIYGYIGGVILGMFIPGTAGSVISILANVSLAVGFYFIYKAFVDYRGQGRFNKSPNMMLFIAVAVNIITAVVNIFSLFGSIGSIIGFILLLLGFRELGKDIMIVQPPAGQPGPYADAPQVEPLEAHPAKLVPSEPIPKAPEPHGEPAGKFCSNCGAKQPVNVKFCQNCGGTI